MTEPRIVAWRSTSGYVHPALVTRDGETLCLAVFTGEGRVLRTFGTERFREGRSGWLEMYEVI